MGCCCNQTELLQRLGTAGPWQLQEVPDQSSQTLSQNASKCIQYVYHSYILIYYNHTHNYINCYHSIMIRLATITITLCTKYLKTYTHTHTYIYVCVYMYCYMVAISYSLMIINCHCCQAGPVTVRSKPISRRAPWSAHWVWQGEIHCKWRFRAGQNHMKVWENMEKSHSSHRGF
jgi:hypothetical protein